MHRLLAAVVVGAALVIQLGLASGPWARADVGAGERSTVVSVDVAGDVEGLADDSAQRAALRSAAGGALRQLTQVMVVLVIVIAGMGVVLDLTPRTWTLVSSVALVCLLAVVVMRDRVVAALATAGAHLDAATFHVETTGWSGVTIGAAVVAALAAILAAAPRPAATDVVVEPERPGAIGTDERAGRGRLGWPSRGRRAQPLH